MVQTLVAGSLIVAANDGFPWLGQSAGVGLVCAINGQHGAHVGGALLQSPGSITA